jgi:U3 small nucleolar RNA-associated protein 14
MIDRVQERMTLKHGLNSKFQKTIKRYHFDKDQQVKEAIKDNFKLRDNLLQKIQGNKNENEFEEEENDSDDSEIKVDNIKEGVEVQNGQKNLIVNFEEKNKITEKEPKDEKLGGVFSMPFMKAAEGNVDLQDRIEKLKNKFNDDEILDDIDNQDKSESEEEENINSENKLSKNEKNGKKSEKKAQIIKKDDLKKIKENTKKINELNEKNQKNPKIDIKFEPEQLQRMIDEEKINEDINEFNHFIVENDINKKEFLENEDKEQLDEIKKNNPEFMPGWGAWAGDDSKIKAQEFLKKKRYEEKIKRLKEQANEANENSFVKISKKDDKQFNQFLVQNLPNDMQTIKQFERYNKTLIGREVNSLNLYRKLIQPKIVNKIGQIINIKFIFFVVIIIFIFVINNHTLKIIIIIFHFNNVIIIIIVSVINIARVFFVIFFDFFVFFFFIENMKFFIDAHFNAIIIIIVIIIIIIIVIFR